MKDGWIVEVKPSLSVVEPKKAWEVLREAKVLTEPVKVENFLLLATKSRDSSMFYPHTLEDIAEAEAFAKNIGLGFKSKPFYIQDACGDVHVTIRGFTFLDKEKSLQIDAANSSYEPSSRLDYMLRVLPSAHVGVGKINGYPQCCIHAYLDDMMCLVDPDQRLAEQVRNYSSKNKPFSKDAFYVEEFLPCKPDCKNASALGLRCEEDLKGMAGGEVAEIYSGLKQQHLQDVEKETIIMRKENGKLNYTSGFAGF